MTTKTNNGPSFKYTKFLVIELVPTDRKKSFRYTAKIGLWQIY